MKNPLNLVLEKIDEGGIWIYDGAFFISGALALCGVVLPFTGQYPRWALSVTIFGFGIGGFIWLFRYLPRTKYFVYFKLDDIGIYHRTSPGSPLDVISWTQVARADPHCAVEEGDCHAIGFGAIAGSLIVGSLLGLVPFVLGRYLGQVRVGRIRFLVSVIASFIAGILGALPASLGFTVAILVKWWRRKATVPDSEGGSGDA
jgi:hypothetical protein